MSDHNQTEPYIKIEIEHLDNLMTLVGELVLNRNQLISYQNHFSQPKLNNLLQQLNRITSELQEEMVRSRMISIRAVYHELERTFHQLCQTANIEIPLKLKMENTEIDRVIVERLKHPFRNFIAHFISAEILEQNPNLQIEIDTNTEENHAKMRVFTYNLTNTDFTYDETFHQSYQPLQTILNGLNGEVHLEHSRHQSIDLSITLPISVAIIPVLIVIFADNFFAIAQSNLQEIIHLNERRKDHMNRINESYFYHLRDELLPIIFLADVLKQQHYQPNGHFIVLQTRNSKFGLLVDKIEDTQEVVVKTLSSQFDDYPVYSGATILGNGQLALILNATEIEKQLHPDANHKNTQWPEKQICQVDHYLLFELLPKKPMLLAIKKILRLNYLDREKIPVIIFRQQGELVGIQVHRFIDIIPLAKENQGQESNPSTNFLTWKNELIEVLDPETQISLQSERPEHSEFCTFRCGNYLLGLDIHDDIEKYKKYRKLWQKYLKESDKIIELSNLNQDREAISLLKGQSQDLFNEANSILIDLVARNKEKSFASKRKSDIIRKQATEKFRSLGVIGLLLVLFIGFFLSKSLSTSIKNLEEIAKKVSRGDFNVEITYHSKDELGNLSDSFREMIGIVKSLGSEMEKMSIAAKQGNLGVRGQKEKFKGAFAQIVEGANWTFDAYQNAIRQITSYVNTLANSSEELIETGREVSKIAESTSEQADKVELVSSNVQLVATGVDQMNTSIREISKSASEAARVATGAVKITETTTKTISQLGDSSTEIGNVIKVITQIAQQTNLLASNATIEAIQADTGDAISAISQISEVINHVNDYQTTIASAVEEQAATVREMARNANEAAGGAREISKNINGVSTAAQNTFRSVGQTQNTAKELSKISNDLNHMVAQFRF